MPFSRISHLEQRGQNITTESRPMSQPRRSFKGDQEAHVDRLLAACQKHEVATAEIKERPLVPFFDTSSDPSAASLFKPLQQSSSMSGIKKENVNGKLKHSKSMSGNPQQQQQQHHQKGTTINSNKNLVGILHASFAAAQASSCAQQQHQQGKGTKKKAAQHQRQPNGAYAGPAFTNSPTPDSLPIPTSSLLL